MKRIGRLDAGGGPACHETERGHMEETKLAERKAMLTELFRDPAYIPMKAKEIAALLNIPKGQREELQEVLDILVAEGTAGISKKGKYGKPESFSVNGIFSGCLLYTSITDFSSNWWCTWMRPWRRSSGFIREKKRFLPECFTTILKIRWQSGSLDRRMRTCLLYTSRCV